MATYSTRPYDSVALQLQSELGSGESLLWSGQAEQSVVFHSSDWFAIPFSLMSGGFAIFWEWGASGHFGSGSHSTPLFFELWGIPFVLIGQYMIWGRFIYMAWRKARTYYGVTNRRVMVVSTGTSRKLTEGYLDNLDSLSLTTRPNGIGTIEFASAERMNPFFSGRRRRGGIPLDIDLNRLAFLDVADARQVYQLIRSERERVRKAGRGG
jgi:hypothetical protein